MKKRYWLPALVLAVIGIVIYLFVYGYGFSGLILFGVGVLFFLFGLMDRLKKRLPRLMQILQIGFCILLVPILLTSVIIGVMIVRAGGGAQEIESDYLIILGAGVNGTAPSRSLRERLTAAEEYLKQHPDTIAILSGGKGNGENISEAACMFNWLTEKGIPAEQLRMEDQATSTVENIRFSLDLIEAETGVRPTKCAVLSSSYHLFRASLLAKSEGLEMQGVPAKVSYPVFYCNMLLREICAVWYTLIFVG